jgi:hypothetical protein
VQLSAAAENLALGNAIAHARADDDDVEVVVHDGSWSGLRGNRTKLAQ